MTKDAGDHIFRHSRNSRPYGYTWTVGNFKIVSVLCHPERSMKARWYRAVLLILSFGISYEVEVLRNVTKWNGAKPQARNAHSGISNEFAGCLLSLGYIFLISHFSKFFYRNTIRTSSLQMCLPTEHYWSGNHWQRCRSTKHVDIFLHIFKKKIFGFSCSKFCGHTIKFCLRIIECFKIINI